MELNLPIMRTWHSGPLKVGKTDEIETIFFEDSIGLQDPYGTSQTSNVLKILSIPVYIDPKYLG